MSNETTETMDYNEFRASTRKARVHFSLPPLILLIMLLLIAAIIRIVLGSKYLVPIPLIFVILGVGVAFVGAFSDFGAKRYLSDLARNRVGFDEQDIAYINKQQLVMTLIYLGIGGLYVVSAFAIYFLFTS